MAKAKSARHLMRMSASRRSRAARSVAPGDAAMANELRDLLLKRTGLAAAQLVCPREKSDMTPCLARDGELVVVYDEVNRPLCVGCEASVVELVQEERARAAK